MTGMSPDRQAGPDTAAGLPMRHAALHAEMVRQFERSVALAGHWILYVFLGFEHLGACVGSYSLQAAGVRLRWPYALLWLFQTGVALGAINLARAWGRVEVSPLQRYVSRTWIIFLLLCWNVAILNVLAGQPVFVFLPVLATLSSFAFLVLTSFLSRRFLPAALTMWVTAGLIARFPQYGFLLYGTAWLLVLETLGVVFFRKQRRWRAADHSQPPLRPSRRNGTVSREVSPVGQG
jgi:hypothetical protein